MTDVIFLLASVCFVLLCVAYISWCDRIITDPSANPDPASGASARPAVPAERVS